MKKKSIVAIVTAFYLTSSISSYATFWEGMISSFYTPRYQEEISVKNELPDKINATGRNTFLFDPKLLAWAAYNKKGVRVGFGKASGGKDFCADINQPCRTVEGEFTVFRTDDKDCKSKTFPLEKEGGAPMPHCMFFHKGYAIHGTKHVPQENSSHGCIRVSKKAAEFLNSYYIKPGSMVIVKPYA